MPTFLADPTHRIKVMASPVFSMATTTKDPSKRRMIDAMGAKHYIGCCILKNNQLPVDQLRQKMTPPIEHFSNNHEWCDVDWCWVKELDSRIFDIIPQISASTAPPSPLNF